MAAYEPLLKELKNAPDFKKYPYALSTTARVLVNSDDYLPSTEFFIKAVKENYKLPAVIYLYGKANGSDDILYLNYWMEIFTKTVKEGALEVYQPSSLPDTALCIGISRHFRELYINDNKANVIRFIVNLFGGRNYVQVVE